MKCRVIRSCLLALLMFVPGHALAQDQTTPPAASDSKLLSAGELEALVAPVALYPDTLLSVVLMASTYPLEVVQADRWASTNKNLKGDQLKAAVEKQQWDGSIRSLVATPSVLTMMSSKLDWTKKLGDAVLAQQPDVMDAIQRLRGKAHENKKLTSTKQQNVTVKREQNKQVIVIEPTDPNTVYVPYYNPAVVYGGWSYPAYPPYYFPPPAYIAGGLVATGLAFGAGYALGRWTSGGNYWGGGVSWNNNNINVNRPVNINNSGNNWQHNSQHRQGVRYNNRDVQQRFGNNRGGGQDRMDFRGRGGDQVLRPGGDRQPGGDRLGGDRPGGDRGSAARPGGGDRGGGARPGGGGDRGAGARPGAGDRGGGGRPSAGTRPSAGAGGPRGDSAFGNLQSGRAANMQSQRGQMSLGGGGAGGGFRGGGGGGFRGGGGGGGFRGGGGGGGFRGGGGGGGRGGGGGGRRSDMSLKHDIVLLGHLDNGIGFYRFRYNDSDRAYVGVMAQEVQAVAPEAVARDRDGYLRVFYERLGLKFQTFDQWVASGARVPHSGNKLH